MTTESVVDRASASAARDTVVCLDCGARMREQYRLTENGWVYVWLVCSGPNCTGQVLRKVPAAEAGVAYDER